MVKKANNKLWYKFNYIGLIVGLLFFFISMMPSLLPRPWFYQGLISGIAVAIGYGFGVLISKCYRAIATKEPSNSSKRQAWRLLIAIGLFGAILGMYLGALWQNEVRTLVGEPALQGRHMFRITLITIIVGYLVVLLARGIRKLTSGLIHFSRHWLPRKVGTAIGLVVSVIILVLFFNGVLFNAFVAGSNAIYSGKNDTTLDGITQPTSPLRSGSSESLVAWDTLGYQGRTFVASGPNMQQLRSVNGANIKPQIRVYAGVESAPTADQRAQLVLKELERTDAFNRKVLIIANATGTGWLEPQSVDSIEYMYGGDSAIASIQYSYLPSWISTLVDTQKASDAGQALFSTIYAKWSKMPVETRPKLITYGLSLGSYSGQAAFSGSQDLAARTDGALFMGTPNATAMWRNITDTRDSGSPEWQPTYQDGVTVRYAAQVSDLYKQSTVWSMPRLVYMQHASDSVVWWSPNLLLHQPDWLRETRGPDVSTNMHWFPFVTFLQVTVDQFFGVSVPNGHGHNYPNSIVGAWAAVIAPADWSDQKANQIQNIINTYSNT